ILMFSSVPQILAIFQGFGDLLAPWWGYLGWLLIALSYILEFSTPVLSPVGEWLKGIMDVISTSLKSSPTDTANWYFLIAIIAIILIAVILNVSRPKKDFVEEFEKKYGHFEELDKK
ncbi:MAG TPA: hypothetical protein VKK79_18860, partial [Candidatus Lokiarchaeia archaeon]|nr:hypothetical protein [Candidatus Lokiarchaeia archaeon]